MDDEIEMAGRAGAGCVSYRELWLERSGEGMQKKESHCKKLQTRARATGVEQPLGGANSTLLAVARLPVNAPPPQDLFYYSQSTIIPSWA